MEEFSMEERPENIYAPLRWRIHNLQNAPFRIFSKVQYEGIIGDIVKWYFEGRDKYSPEILESLEEEIESLLVAIDTILERSEIIFDSHSLYQKITQTDSYISDEEQKAKILATNKIELLEELNYYSVAIFNLIESRDKQDLLNIQKAKGKFKFLMSSKVILALLQLMRERDLIKAPSDAELCRLISENIYTIRADENLTPRNLAQHTNPDAPTIASLKTILTEMLKNIKDLENRKYK
jgi:hypothetical protein